MDMYRMLMCSALISGFVGCINIGYGVPAYVHSIKNYGANTLEALQKQGHILDGLFFNAVALLFSCLSQW